MQSSSKRTLVFFSLCIPLRLFAAWWSFKYPLSNSTAMLAACYAVAGISMIYFFLSNSRLAAPEGGGNTWWNAVRPLFGMLYLLFALYTAKGYRQSYKFLLADVILGLVVWVSHMQCPSVQITPFGESQLVHEAHKAQLKNRANPAIVVGKSRTKAVMVALPIALAVVLAISTAAARRG